MTLYIVYVVCLFVLLFAWTIWQKRNHSSQQLATDGGGPSYPRSDYNLFSAATPAAALGGFTRAVKRSAPVILEPIKHPVNLNMARFTKAKARQSKRMAKRRRNGASTRPVYRGRAKK